MKNLLNILPAFIILIVFIGLVTLIFNMFQPTKWSAFYQSSSGDLVNAQIFKNKEECQRWIYGERHKYDGRTGFECGSNCTPPTSEMGAWRCKDTID